MTPAIKPLVISRLPRRHRQLDAAMRERLAAAWRLGLRQKEIAALLGVHPSTVGRELRRNSPMGFYDPKLAHLLCRMRRLYNAMGRRRPFLSSFRYHALSQLPAPRTWICWFSDTNEYDRWLPYRRPRYAQWENRRHRVYGRRRRRPAWPGPTRSPFVVPRQFYAPREFAQWEKPVHFRKNRILLDLMGWELDQRAARRKNPGAAAKPPLPDRALLPLPLSRTEAPTAPQQSPGAATRWAKSA